MLRVTIDRDACIGSENCTRFAANTFRTDASGKVEVIDTVTDSEQDIRRAVEACPVAALGVDDSGVSRS